MLTSRLTVASSETALPIVVIEPTRGWAALRLRELLEHRELLGFLAWRDITVRYRQTLLGAAWALLQPMAAMAAFSLVFGRLARLPSDGLPYPLFAFCGLLPWQCFATALGASANSLVGNAALISKVYFPRLVLPIASTAPALVDLAVSLLALLVMMAGYGVRPTARWLLLPLLIAWLPLASLSAGLWLSALSVRYRDVRHTLPFLTQLWMFVSPVVYPASLFPVSVRPWLGLNPMAGVVETYRWALLGTAVLDWRMVALSAVVTLALLFSGTMFFRRTERAFADVV